MTCVSQEERTCEDAEVFHEPNYPDHSSDPEAGFQCPPGSVRFWGKIFIACISPACVCPPVLLGYFSSDIGENNSMRNLLQQLA